MLIPALSVFLAHRMVPQFHFLTAWLTPAALAVLVLWAGLVFPYLGNFARFGDFSYGVYIYHFPIIQTLVAFGLYKDQPLTAAALTLVLTLMAAAGSWHLIEKRWLRRDSHYILAGQQGQNPHLEADSDSQTDSQAESKQESGPDS